MSAAENNREGVEYIDELVFKLECFIDHATGGKLSKSSWALETLKAACDEHFNAQFDALCRPVREAPPDERDVAEATYTGIAFDYAAAPVGSRDWKLFWDGWLHSRAALHIPTALDHFIADVEAAEKCLMCNGHGMIGGLLPGDGGYDGQDCPDCSGSGVRPIVLEALELVAMQPATRGVYLLDQQDMDFVKKAVKALKGQA